MTRKKGCNKTRDTMQSKLQVTSVTLGFSSDSFLMCKLLKNCFEIIYLALRCSAWRDASVEIRVSSFPIWVGAAWCCSLSFATCACLTLVKPSVFSMVFFTRAGMGCACWCLCVFMSARTPVRSQLWSAKLFWGERKKKQTKWDDWQ